MGFWIFGKKKPPVDPDIVWEELEKQTDHCSGVAEWYADCCREHDFNYRTKIVSRAEADRRFRQCMQSKSKLGRFSPVSWVRWSGVRLFGWLAD